MQVDVTRIGQSAVSTPSYIPLGRDSNGHNDSQAAGRHYPRCCSSASPHNDYVGLFGLLPMFARSLHFLRGGFGGTGWIAAVWCILVFLPSAASAFANVSGAISSDTTWDLAGSPYVLTS